MHQTGKENLLLNPQQVNKLNNKDDSLTQGQGESFMPVNRTVTLSCQCCAAIENYTFTDLVDPFACLANSNGWFSVMCSTLGVANSADLSAR